LDEKGRFAKISLEKGTFLALFATVPTSRDGKAAKKARKSEDLPELKKV